MHNGNPGRFEKYNLFGHIVGHVGDGNFYVQLMVNPNDKNEIEALNFFLDRLSKERLTWKEHVQVSMVGQGKKQYLIDELGPCKFYEKNKINFDPNNIMNPGKVF